MPEFLTFQTAAIIAVAALVVFLCITIFRRPIKFLFRMLLNTVGGFITLFLLNWVGGFIGISLGLNWFNAIIVGILGLPGVGLLLILQWLMLI